MSDREVARQKNQTNLILFKERDDSSKNLKLNDTYLEVEVR